MRNPRLFFELSPGAIVQAQAHHLDPVKFNTEITLRDLAATAAMKALLSYPAGNFIADELAERSVYYADALLVELEKQP